MKSCRGLAKGGAVAWNTWPSRRRPQRSLTIWCRRKKKQGGVYPELAHGNSRRGRIAPRLHFVSLGEHFLAGNVGAEEGTRTPTAFRPPAPKAGASANSATSAMSASIASPLGGRAAEPSRLPLPGPCAFARLRRRDPSGGSRWHIARNVELRWRKALRFARLAARPKARVLLPLLSSPQLARLRRYINRWLKI